MAMNWIPTTLTVTSTAEKTKNSVERKKNVGYDVKKDRYCYDNHRSSNIRKLKTDMITSKHQQSNSIVVIISCNNHL